MSLQLTSAAFTNNGVIPVRYTCNGQNLSPPLTIADVPNGAKSLALILHDPDAPRGNFTHWLLWNVGPQLSSLAEGTVPAGARQGMADFGKVAYGGPCPPSGTHRYMFDLYA